MFGRRMNRGYGYRQQPDMLDGFLAVEAEMDAVQDFASGDIVGGMLEMDAAQDFASGDTFGGFIDQGIADIF